jgi:hypothetical protein
MNRDTHDAVANRALRNNTAPLTVATHPTERSASSGTSARNRFRCAALLLCSLFVPATSGRAQQSDNHALHAVPTPGPVATDGKLDDWDLTGQVEVFANYRTRNTYSAKVAAMYDRDNFYVAIAWRDPTPLQNMVNAEFELGSGWKSDCVQLRLKTDVTMTLDCWYSTAARKPVINIQYGSFDKKSPMHSSKLVPFAEPNAVDAGAQEAFAIGEDGKSYTQEIAIPWKFITGANVHWKESGKPVSERTGYGAGEQFNMGMEFLWGGADGRTFPIHRYADLLKEGQSSREFFWYAENAWAPVILEPKGHLNLPAPDYAARAEAYLQKTEGPVKLAYTMPFDGFVTLVVEDEQGRRVKNLIGMAPRSKGPRTDSWDCTDENGKHVAPGTYRFRGLQHQGIDPVYEATYGTPGIPPWDTGDGTGAWLSDHCAPRAVAAGGDMLALGAERGESGYAIIGVDDTGRKRWGDRSLGGIHSLAADTNYVYVFLSSWDVKPTLARLEMKTGRYAPFTTQSGPQLKVPVFRDGEPEAWIPGFASGPERLAVPIPSTNQPSRVRFFDKRTAAVTGELPVPKLGVVAYDRGGTLCVWTEGRVARVVDGKMKPFVERDLPEWSAGMAFDAEGRLLLIDAAKQQVRLYGTDGKFIRAIGRPGGRPKAGKWQPDGLLNPVALAVDSRGQVWVAEEDGSPKRISVWSEEGALIRDFIGPTGYGGTGANADPADKTRVFGSGCEWKLDYGKNQATVTAVLGDVSGEFMRIQGREYFMTKNGRLYLRTGDTLRPVAAIGNPCVKDLDRFKDIPLPPVPSGTHGYATMTVAWSDLNDDGVAQSNEVVCGSRWTGWNDVKLPVGTSGYFGSYWLDEDLSICSIAGESWGAYGGRPPMVTKTPRKGWTPGGAPVWDLAQQVLIAQPPYSGCLYLRSEGKTIFGAPITCVRDDGATLWTYKDNWAGVHGSHNAPIPERDDVLIGTLGCIGRAKTALGMVFALHSNMGRLYLITTDGLFVAGVFQDCRLGGDSWPDSTRAGAPLGGVTMGSEWFGGHFFKSEKTDEYYLIAGFTAYNLIKLNGIDKLQPIAGDTVKVTPEDLRAAEARALQRAATEAAARTLAIARVSTPPAFDGKLGGFATNAFVAWSSGPYRLRAGLAADATHLYLAYDVAGDDNPMVNGGKDVKQLFTTGDSVDLQLGTDSSAPANRTEAAVGDVRLLISVFEGKPVAVLYRWKAKGDRQPVTFTCPWRSHTVDRVDVLADARINITRRGGGYVVEAAVPLAALGFSPVAGQTCKTDLGVIFSDAKGDNRAARVYWSNKATGLTADVPGEIMAFPSLWGTATVEP